MDPGLFKKTRILLDIYAVHSRESIRELAVQDFLFKTTKKAEFYLFFV